MLKRLMAVMAVLGVFLALGVAVGISATPRQIYRDLAKNGQADHRYTAADLRKGLKNPTSQGYHKPTEPAPSLARRTADRSPLTKSKGGVLPFTGLDLSFIAAGAILLMLVGGGLRILVRKS